MSAAVIGSLRIVLGMDSAAFNDGIGLAQKRARGFERSLKKMGARLGKMGSRLSLGLTAPLVALTYKAIAAQKEQEQAIAAVTQGLNSMGYAAGFTADQLTRIAAEMQSKSLYGDEKILNKVTANLLTFGNIAGDVFIRTQQLALDLSARLGTDLQSSAIMLGKALNDPVVGLSALQRVGISFTKQQKDQILAMTKAGKVAEAQKLILAELEKQYGGQAAALAKTDTGKIAQAWNSIGDALEKVGAIVLPILADFAGYLKSAAEKFQKLSPTIQTAIVVVAALTAALGPVLIALGLIVTGSAPIIAAVAGISASFGVLTAAMFTLRGALLLTGFGALIVGAGYLVLKFVQLSERVGGFGVAMGLLKDVASEVWGRISDGAWAVRLAVRSLGMSVQASWAKAMARMTTGWGYFVQAVAGAAFTVPGMSGIGDTLFAKSEEIKATAKNMLSDVKDLNEAASNLGFQSQHLFGSLTRPLASISALKSATNNQSAIDLLTQEDAIYTRLSGTVQKVIVKTTDLGGAATVTGSVLKKAATVAIESFDSLAQTMADSIGNGFMDMVTGTKTVAESFRSMAADVVRELYRVLVVQRMVSSLKNIFGGFGGFNSGKLFTGSSFAGGGFTGNGPRAGGMDGQGGFLAMMHPRETVIDHARGQSGGSSTTRVELYLSGDLDARIASQSEGVAVTVFKSGISEFSNESLPHRVQQIAQDGKAIG
ncbi:MAG: hypothetical protein GXP05_04395 [Alphaproteobacteria bacterium]|nr:hypothetical protein [Alphaproteobacteria bacterium]